MAHIIEITLTVFSVLTVGSIFATVARVHRADSAVRRENDRRRRQWESDCANARVLGVLPPVPPNRISLG